MKKLSISVLIDFIISIAVFGWILYTYLRQTEDGQYQYTLENVSLFLILLAAGIAVMFVGILLKDERPHILSIAIFGVATYFSGPHMLLSIVFVGCAVLNFFEQRKANTGKDKNVSAAVKENRLYDASSSQNDAGGDE